MIARDEADISDLQQRVDFTQIGVEHRIRTFNRPELTRLSGGEGKIRTCMGLSLSSGVFRFIARSLFGAGKAMPKPSSSPTAIF